VPAAAQAVVAFMLAAADPVLAAVAADSLAAITAAAASSRAQSPVPWSAVRSRHGATAITADRVTLMHDEYYDDGAVAVGPAPGGDDAVAYCMQTYRSYDPASGTYLGFDGLRHPCP
jgi:hypothetical protein